MRRWHGYNKMNLKMEQDVRYVGAEWNLLAQTEITVASSRENVKNRRVPYKTGNISTSGCSTIWTRALLHGDG